MCLEGEGSHPARPVVSRDPPRSLNKMSLELRQAVAPRDRVASGAAKSTHSETQAGTYSKNMVSNGGEGYQREEAGGRKGEPPPRSPTAKENELASEQREGSEPSWHLGKVVRVEGGAWAKALWSELVWAICRTAKRGYRR